MSEDLAYINHTCGYRPMEPVFKAFAEKWAELSTMPVFDSGLRQSLVRSVRSPECRGWVAMLGGEEERQLASELSLPVLNYSNRLGPCPHAANLFFDDLEIGRVAAETFLSKGHRNFVIAEYDKVIFSDARVQGFQDRLAAEGLRACHWTLDPSLRENPLRFDLQRRKLFKRWFEDLDLPASIFCVNDDIALSVLRMAETHLGERAWLLSVAGVDDAGASLGMPNLSSVRPNFAGLGAALAEALSAALEKGLLDRGSMRLVGGARWVERESTWGGPGARNPLVSRCVRLTAMALAEGVAPSVSFLAGNLGVSRRTLLSRFKDATGRTLRDYLIGERLKYAAKLLRETDRSIADIAFASGFSKQSNLSHRFRRIYGMTPRDFRQEPS